MLTERKEQLLRVLVEEYIESVQPIGSRALGELSGLDVSAPTIRNELRALEEAGYLMHPHTSAGRIPTEQGYRYYVHELLPSVLNVKKKKAVLPFSSDALTTAEARKGLARSIAEQSGNAVILSLGRGHVYYTGMSHLFAQPEFHDYAQTVQVSAVFDHCEEHLPALREQAKERGVDVYIGSENPLGAACSSIVSVYPDDVLMLILGPLRMRYRENLTMMNVLAQQWATA